MKLFLGLSNNALKIIACVAMFIDHLGYLVFPEVLFFRIVGRLAFPIFAYMIAEGCYYTHNKLKHFLLIFLLGIIMQMVSYLFAGVTDFSIFLVFSASILIIYLIDNIADAFKEKYYMLSGCFLFVTIVVCFGLACIELDTKVFFENYGLYGVFTPVLLYILRKFLPDYQKLFMLITLAVCTTMYAFYMQWLPAFFALLAIPILVLYNGKRGKLNLKYFFYIFYPLHIWLLQIIANIVHG